MRTRTLPGVTVGRARCSTVRGEDVEVTTSVECVCGSWMGVAVVAVEVDMMYVKSVCGNWDADVQ